MLPPATEVPENYTKPEGREQPRSFIVIFSGGTVRERDYFSPILCHPSLFPELRLEFVAEDRFEPNGYPSVFSLAKKEVERYRSSADEICPDKYFVATDVDDFKRHVVAFRSECGKYGIQLMISNPCIEVWLYYSRRGDGFEGFAMPEDSSKRSNAVKTFLGEKIAGGVNPKKALFDIQQNIDNAKKNYKEDAKDFPLLLSTNMYLLAEVLLPFVRKGLKVLQHGAAQGR